MQWETKTETTTPLKINKPSLCFSILNTSLYFANEIQLKIAILGD